MLSNGIRYRERPISQSYTCPSHIIQINERTAKSAPIVLMLFSQINGNHIHEHSYGNQEANRTEGDHR